MRPIEAHHLKLIRLAFAWAALISAYFYFFEVVMPFLETRMQLVESLVQGNEKADYQYAMFFVAKVHHWLTTTFGHPLIWHALTDCTGILFVFWCAFNFISTESGSLAGYIAGLMFLVIPMPMFMIDHFYHPTDFWAVGLVFFILKAARAEKHLELAFLLFISGMLWEKALFVPAIYGLYILYKRGFVAAIKAAILPAAGAAFWFLWNRITFPDAPRILLTTTEQFFKNLPIDLVSWFLWIGPLFIPFSSYLKSGWKSDPFWLFWLLYIPILITTLITLTAYWGELRTFWILQPIIVGFAAAVFHSAYSPLKKLTTDSYLKIQQDVN